MLKLFQCRIALWLVWWIVSRLPSWDVVATPACTKSRPAVTGRSPEPIPEPQRDGAEDSANIDQRSRCSPSTDEPDAHHSGAVRNEPFPQPVRAFCEGDQRSGGGYVCSCSILSFGSARHASRNMHRAFRIARTPKNAVLGRNAWSERHRSAEALERRPIQTLLR